MKINDKILSIPPYISTTWKHITSIHLDPGTHSVLHITTTNGLQIQIPELPTPEVERIFHFHEVFLENLEKEATARTPQLVDNEASIALGFPMRGELMQHQSELKDAPDLPKEMLSKIRGIAKSLGVDISQGIGRVDPHCNCPFCQIAKAMQEEETEEVSEEIITEEDLHFPLWKVEKQDHHYLVSNSEEIYEVHLDDPIRCTCGALRCVHIEAVLRS